MDIRKRIKFWLFNEDMTMVQLCKLLSERTGKHMSNHNLSNKLRKNLLRYEELELICDILGYDIEFKKK